MCLAEGNRKNNSISSSAYLTVHPFLVQSHHGVKDGVEVTALDVALILLEGLRHYTVFS